MLSLRAIAEQLGLPESTVRYYRDAFAARVPCTGAGRRRRYPPEALEVLRFIADGFAAGRARSEIEDALEAGGYPAAVSTAQVVSWQPLPRDEVVATILDGERERREAMWQMAREIVRLGEAIERQQVVLAAIAESLAREPRALPAPANGHTPETAPAPATGSGELEQLRQQLAEERDLVERLRRSRLELERRAATAEQRLTREPSERPGIIKRLLNRD